MTNRPNTIITKLLRIAAPLVLALTAFAHGGFDHVLGTVAAMSGNVLTVRTAAGKVDVKLDAKTEISRDDRKAALSDLKPGVRVVVDIPEGSKDRVAHSVKIGSATVSGHTEPVK